MTPLCLSQRPKSAEAAAILFVLQNNRPDDRPRQVFVSYSHRDEAWKDRVVAAMRPLEAQQRITAWHDRKLMPGDDWDGEIRGELERADVILLLVSPDFVASRYCRAIEVQRAVERRNAGDAVLVPIILRACAWRGEAFARFQAYPLDGTPLADAADPDVFDDLREKLNLALLGWWYPRRPRAGAGPHAVWQLQYRPTPVAPPPDPAALLHRLRELAEEPDIHRSGAAQAQMIGGTARAIDPVLLLDGPAAAFARLEALHGQGRLAEALGVEIVDFRLVLGAAMRIGSMPAMPGDRLEAREKLLLRPGNREVPDMPQVLAVRDTDPRWMMVLPARGPNAATPKALFAEAQARFAEYVGTILAMPEGRLTVNLSPYEPDDILPPALRGTRLGQELVEQDCRLKQLAASLLHPDADTGRAYWRAFDREARALGGDAGAMLSAYQKVWIVPGNASVGAKDPDHPLGNAGMASLGVRETDRVAWIEACDLQVMCDVDYQAMEHQQRAQGNGSGEADTADRLSAISVACFRDIVLPALTAEINEGAWFAATRQIYHAFVLATWVRRELKPLPVFAPLFEIVDRGAPEAFGVARRDAAAEAATAIYQRYLALFAEGVFRCARPDETGRPRIYFAGGIQLPAQVSGGYYSRKNCLRCSGVNWRGMIARACSTSALTVGNIRQIRAVPSYEAVNARSPDPSNTALATVTSWPRRTAIWAPVVASHSRAVLSSEAVSTRAPDGSNTAPVTASSCPRNNASSAPVAKSQSRAVLSLEAVSTRAPAGSNIALCTKASWPRSTANSAPVVASHSRAVLSQEAVRTCDPVESNTALMTLVSWPRRMASSLPVTTSQIRAVPSHDAVATRAPDGSNAALAIPTSWPLRTASWPRVVASHSRAVPS